MRSSRSIGNEMHASPPCRWMRLHAWASQLDVATIIQDRGDLRRRASSVTRQSSSARSAITISAKKNDCRCACSAESARPSIRISKPAACRREASWAPFARFGSRSSAGNGLVRRRSIRMEITSVDGVLTQRRATLSPRVASWKLPSECPRESVAGSAGNPARSHPPARRSIRDHGSRSPRQKFLRCSHSRRPRRPASDPASRRKSVAAQLPCFWRQAR